MQFAVTTTVGGGQVSAPRGLELRQEGGFASLSKHLSTTGGGGVAKTDLSFLDRLVSPDSSDDATFNQGKTLATGWKLQAPILKWSPALENQFGHAAARVALGKASTQELEEFHKLERARRQTFLVRPGDQILRDFEERQRTADLVRALQRYVEIAAY